MASGEIGNALHVEGIVKAYGATVALDHASFTVSKGEVHALLGENGAGKSTAVKILAGLVQPDSGVIELFGERVRLARPRDAQALGVQTAFQEMALVRDLTVTENMLLPHAPTGPLGQLRRREGERLVSAHLASLGLGDIDPRAETGDLELSVRQKIEIARAIFRRPRILLLDEPTSTLSGRDIDWLGGLIGRLRASGVTTVFISHRLREVRAFCDTMTVLRNGKHIATGPVSSYSDDEVIRMIAGRALSHAFPPREGERQLGPEVLAVERISTSGKLREASFSLRAGEILGVAGLQGMGQLDLFLACFGMTDLTAGHLRIDGEPIVITSPTDAVRANIGISLVPEDRKTEALSLKLSGKHNTSLPVIDRFSRGPLIDGSRETAAVEAIFERVDVDRRALWTRVGAFSGGNQQKIAIAKWLLAESRVLLLFDPTRGIDVGTKNELYRLIRAYADAGGAVLLHSTEIPELVYLCDRALVCYAGRIVSEIPADQLSEEAILRAALGAEAVPRRAA